MRLHPLCHCPPPEPPIIPNRSPLATRYYPQLLTSQLHDSHSLCRPNIHGSVRSLPMCVWWRSLSKVVSRFIHVVPHVRTSFLVTAQ